MDAAETREIAVAALLEFRDAALNDPATYAGGRNGAAEVAGTVQAILDLMQPNGATNPRYVRAHEATAALVALAATDPDAYGTLVGPVAQAYRGRADVAPGSREGLLVILNLVNAIGDDHDWAVDRSGPAPVIRSQSGMAHHEPTLCPQSFLETLEPLVDARAPAPGR